MAHARVRMRGARARLDALEGHLRALLADPPAAGSSASIALVPAVSELPLLASGKVREMYDLGEEILMVASDRVSTYDVVHPTPIPGKGSVLTGLSRFWFARTEHICPNHLVSATDGVPEEVRGRALAVRKLEMVPVECVVRGYITGSGWKDYRATGAVCGIALPRGLRESERLPEPIFTPATKAQLGDHDENVDFERAVEIVGDRELMEELRRLSLALYHFALEHALERGIILADTKFEFGRDRDGRLVLGDEALTPGLLALLAGRGLRAGPPAAELRQADRARLGLGDGLGQAPAGPCAARRGRRAHPRSLPGGLRADHRRALRGLALGDRRVVRARVLVRPKAGILDPQGKAVERALPALGFDRREQRPRRPADRARRRGSRPPRGDVRAPADQPAHRGLRDRGWGAGAARAGRERHPVIGVIRFPGSCDEVDALGAASLVDDARILWHRETDLHGVDAVIVPGRLLLRRLPARRRDRPLLADHGRGRATSPAAGGPVLGICNGFQVLCEAGLLPGALLANQSLRFVCRQVEVEVIDAGTAFTRACEEGERLSVPVKHTAGCWFAPPEQLGDVRVVLRYAPGQNPNGSVADVAGVANAAGNVVGLMPHPEHAVDALVGSSDGLKLLSSLARVGA